MFANGASFPINSGRTASYSVARTPVGGKNDPSPAVESQALAPDIAPKKDDTLTFADVMDMVNPLQHIPVVSNLYQSATGDSIGSAAKVVGGALFGGPLGVLFGLGSALFDSFKTSSDEPYAHGTAPNAYPEGYPDDSTIAFINLGGDFHTDMIATKVRQYNS